MFLEHRPKTPVIVARIEGHDWICDTGYGKYGIRQPLRLDRLNEVIRQQNDRFYLSRDQQERYFLSSNIDGPG